MDLNDLSKMSASMENTPKMPVLFLGHGSPMNAIEENEFVQGFRKVATQIPEPKAIVCISAHWETNGTFVTAMQNPPTIHDFGGFPQALFDVQYPAPGSPELAVRTKELIHSTNVVLDQSWGLDHGAWSVIRHLYPNANIPVIQMSIDYNKVPKYHYELGQQIKLLREKGILIIGSGNMVHNLRMVDWRNINTSGSGYDWAIEADEKMKKFILDQNHTALINFRSQGRVFDLAIPTPEHYLPLLYVLGLKDSDESVSLFNDNTLGGSLSMTSVKIG
ncbi:4,5-DOPA dioxygenase extradiol [Galbibacter sp.]|uniref:4,5-DOPA-extradiol-dioxygenase n=1 Tax=Galbibacter sp. TaxID=2918471 RepID=UPI002B8EB86B|nr:4,5-DOPA dioxygenase extradiol [Galbibacter sp.]HLV62606.1 4,5-DOPA dioxygenase extradiol [Galbibacter sp.]